MGYEFRQRLREQVQIQVQKQLQEQVQLKSKEAFTRGIELNLRQNVIGLHTHNVPVATIAASVGKTEAEVEEIIRSGQSV